MAELVGQDMNRRLIKFQEAAIATYAAAHKLHYYKNNAAMTERINTYSRWKLAQFLHRLMAEEQGLELRRSGLGLSMPRIRIR